MSRWEDLETELLADSATKREFDKLVPRYAVISELIAARIKRKMTQADVAQKVGTKQSAIARLESGEYNPTVAFLGKVADALDMRLAISLKSR